LAVQAADDCSVGKVQCCEREGQRARAPCPDRLKL
jgi:hypothetical protein